MNQGKYVFSQIMEFVPLHKFHQCVQAYNGHYRLKSLSCWDQFLAMAFGQLACRESLRDVVTCLEAQRSKMYHLGFRSSVTRATLARMNEKRDWRIFRDFAHILIDSTRKLYTNDQSFDLDLEGSCYVIDSSTIDLCLNIHRWARLLKARAAVRLHLQMDLEGNIPAFFHLTTAKMHDVKFLDMIDIETGAYYVLDRGYIDFKRLNNIHRANAFFIVRAKAGLVFKRMHSQNIDRSEGLRCDQIIKLDGVYARRDYPDKMRRIKYYDQSKKKHFVFLTNNFDLEAETIVELYRNRWQVELFFKWIKQHLRIKSFWGYSENVVKTQICIAICVYLLVAILRKKLNVDRNLYEILQILSVSLFDKIPLHKLISEIELQNPEEGCQKQQCFRGF